MCIIAHIRPFAWTIRKKGFFTPRLMQRAASIVGYVCRSVPHKLPFLQRRFRPNATPYRHQNPFGCSPRRVVFLLCWRSISCLRGDMCLVPCMMKNSMCGILSAIRKRICRRCVPLSMRRAIQGRFIRKFWRYWNRERPCFLPAARVKLQVCGHSSKKLMTIYIRWMSYATACHPLWYWNRA